MKTFLFGIVALAGYMQVSAQAISIISYKVKNPLSVDSCAVPTPAALAALPSLGTPATNASWDLSGVAVQSTFVTYAYKAKTSGYPTASYSDSLTNQLGSSALTSFKAWRNIQQTQSGEFILGEEVITRQAKSLGPLTGNGVDSLIFPVQANSYGTARLRILKFPATMGTVWVDSVVKNLDFNITVTAAGLNSAPGIQKQRHLSVDSVVGWGQMRVPIVGKTKSVWIKVLQVHHVDVAVDSFFLNNAPAPQAVLTLIGATQGQSNTVARTYFYRENATRPLIELIHTTAQHNSKAGTFYIHAVDLEEATAVQNVLPSTSIHLYPNPVTGSNLKVDFPASASGEWAYEIFNIAGQQVLSGLFATTPQSKTGVVEIPAQFNAGTYTFSLLNNGRKISTVLFMISK